eukprot:scaffold1572_cov141-Skeletonema_menzelii.AAC.15
MGSMLAVCICHDHDQGRKVHVCSKNDEKMTCGAIGEGRQQEKGKLRSTTNARRSIDTIFD